MSFLCIIDDCFIYFIKSDYSGYSCDVILFFVDDASIIIFFV